MKGYVFISNSTKPTAEKYNSRDAVYKLKYEFFFNYEPETIIYTPKNEVPACTMPEAC